jgi:hypothetical protein
MQSSLPASCETGRPALRRTSGLGITKNQSARKGSATIGGSMLLIKRALGYGRQQPNGVDRKLLISRSRGSNPGGLTNQIKSLIEQAAKVICRVSASRLLPYHSNPVDSAFNFSWRALSRTTPCRFWNTPERNNASIGMFLAFAIPTGSLEARASKPQVANPQAPPASRGRNWRRDHFRSRPTRG